MKNRVHEGELLIPALKIIEKNPNINTSKLIEELEKEVKLYPQDKEILQGRNDTYFSQTVRNLCGSHLDTNEFGSCVKVKNKNNVNTFSINSRGKKILKMEEQITNEDIYIDENYQKEIDDAQVYNDTLLRQASEREPRLIERKSDRYYTDPRIAKTVIAKNGYKCENAILLNEEHKTFTTKKQVEYQEGHHLIPMKAQKDFKVNLDRPENIVSLCPTCHRQIHNACKKERLKILKRLFDDRIEALNKVDIEITFEDLYNKYYI